KASTLWSCYSKLKSTLLIKEQVDISKHGGWKSNSVVEGYIDESVENKKEIC
ncbi:unnamed protein product, partial [Tenebrio molitor]